MLAQPQPEEALFEREIELEERELEGLLELLADEQRLLTRHPDEQLLGIAAEKSKRLASLERLVGRRNEFLESHGFHGDSDGMLAWLSRHPERALAAQAWRRLEDATRRARSANEINGELLLSRMRSVQRRLSLFQGVASNDPTYSPRGFPGPTPSRQILRRA